MRKIYFFVLSFFITLNSWSQNYEIYVSDAGNFNNPPWQILKFAADGSNPQVFINTNLGWPQDILFLENQNVVLISNLTTNTITRHDATTGQYINNFATGISGPTRMKIGADSLLYVLQWSGNGKVLRYDLTGTFVDEFTDLGVPAAIGLDWDNSGNLYISSYTNGQIYKFSATGNSQGILISTLNGPTNIWIENNDIFIIEYNAGKIKQFSLGGSFVNDFITGLSQPEGIASRPNGNLLIGNGGTSSVKEYSSTGLFVNNVIPAGSGNLIQPNAVVLRNLTTSVSEINNEYINVNPAIGSQFNIVDFNNRIKGIIIYNGLGIQVEKINNKKEWNWNAEKYSDGLYFIRITLKDGKNIFEKVIVKK